MAEGGIAASMGNVNSNDSWQVHFRDTMRGGKFLNSWRMAELHAKEAPDRVWELETYGALFDRTPDGRISQRNFGGHEYPRLAHVGDRTGLELIRTLQQKIVSLQQDDERESGDPESRLKVFAEVTITDLLQDPSGRHRRRLRLLARVGPLRALQRARRRARHRRHRQVVQGHVELVGVHRRRARPGPARRVDPRQHGVHPVPPDGHGLAALGQGHPRHRVGARRRRRPEELRGQALHVRLRARRLPRPVRRDRGGGRPLVHRPRQQQAAARAAPPRRGGARHQLRGQGRPRVTARRRLPRHRLAAHARRRSSRSCRRCTTSSRSWPTSTSRRSRWRSARRATTSWAVSRSTPTPRPPPGCPASSPPERCPAACTGPTASAATRCPTCSSSAPAPERGAAAYVQGLGDRRPDGRPVGHRRGRGDGARALRGGGRREPLHPAPGDAADDERPRRHHPHGRGDRARARQARGAQGARPAPHRRGPPAVQPGLAPRARPAQHARRQRVRRAGGAAAPGEPRRPHPRRLPDDGPAAGAAATSSARPTATASRCDEQPMPAMRGDLLALFEHGRAGQVPHAGRAGRTCRHRRRTTDGSGS